MSRLSARVLVALAFPLILAGFPPTADAVQNPHAAHLISVKSQVTKPKAPDAVPIVAPPGSAVYEAHRGDSIPSFARQYLKKSSF